MARRLTLLHGQWRPRFSDQLFGGLIEADQWLGRIVRAVIDLDHVLHRRDEGRVLFRRDHPVLCQVRLEFVFFNARATVL